MSFKQPTFEVLTPLPRSLSILHEWPRFRTSRGQRDESRWRGHRAVYVRGVAVPLACTDAVLASELATVKPVFLSLLLRDLDVNASVCVFPKDNESRRVKLLQKNGRGVMAEPATALNDDWRLSVSVVVLVTVDFFFLITGRGYVAT